MESLQEKALIALMFTADNKNPILRHLLKHGINFNNLTEDCLYLIFQVYKNDYDIIKNIPPQVVWDIIEGDLARENDSDHPDYFSDSDSDD